jgi:uncharacterized zinc-type alcohol dehydrogenase-like protein
MPNTKAYAAKSARTPLESFSLDRREVGPKDVKIEIQYCGVCHTDIHQVKDEWGGSSFPMVPGHEIVGRVTQVGTQVTKHKVGDTVGVGCFVDSCRTCDSCKKGLQQYCLNHLSATYNSTEQDKKTPTQGGYSSQIVTTEDFVLKISPTLPLEKVAPLLCAGITTYSPLRHWKVGKGHKVGVLGLGGLGHMAVKLAASMGAEVTVLSTSKKKEADARKLGAHQFALTNEPAVMAKLEGSLDFIIDTVSAQHDLNSYLGLLKPDGAMILLGVPPKSPEVDAFSLIGRRRTLAGSLVGGIPETQEMLDYCAQKGITADVEVIKVQDINGAYERMLRGDVHYRFVIDMKSL